MKLRALVVILSIGAGGCQAGNDSAPPKAQAGSLTEVPAQAAPPVPPPEVPAPKATPPPKQTAPAALPAAEARRSGSPSQSIVSRETPATKLPPARVARGRSEAVPPPSPTAAPPPAPRKSGYTGPSTGTIRWFGTVEPEGVIVIDGDTVSTGSMAGALPGVPVLVQLLSKDVVIIEVPAPGNGWRRLRLRSRVKQSALIVQWTVLP